MLVLVAIVALLALGVWRRLHPEDRRPFRAELRSALDLSRGELLALVIGAGLGMLLLLPVLSIGFPTVLAAGIADGWARSVLSKWLSHNSLVDSVQGAGRATVRSAATRRCRDELGAGYEYLIGLVSTVTGRPTYQTALPVAALAGPIALSGWTWLQA